jgi:hypothetical protein
VQASKCLLLAIYFTCGRLEARRERLAGGLLLRWFSGAYFWGPMLGTPGSQEPRVAAGNEVPCSGITQVSEWG